MMRNISDTAARKLFEEAIDPVYIRLYNITYNQSLESIKLYAATSYIGLRRYGNSDNFDICVNNILKKHGNSKTPLVSPKTRYWTGASASEKERVAYDMMATTIKEIYSIDDLNRISDYPSAVIAVRFFVDVH